MRKLHFAAACLLAFCLCALCAPAAAANSAEPPGLIVTVAAPPEDLSLSLQVGADTVPLHKEVRGWEATYRFFYHDLDHFDFDEMDTTLRVESAGASFTCPLPSGSMDTYNNLLTLHLNSQALTPGQSPWRSPLLALLRVVSTLLIEGAVFFAFGYRTKRSWRVFLLTNLVTQGGLHLMFMGPLAGPYWLIGYAAAEVAILLIETAAFCLALHEHSGRRAVAYAACANVSSLLLGGWMLAHLPI